MSVSSGRSSCRLNDRSCEMFNGKMSWITSKICDMIIMLCELHGDIILRFAIKLLRKKSNCNLDTRTLCFALVGHCSHAKFWFLLDFLHKSPHDRPFKCSLRSRKSHVKMIIITISWSIWKSSLGQWHSYYIQCIYACTIRVRHATHH